MHFKADVIDHPSGCVVRLAGRLQAEHVPDLLSACDECRGRLRLDLADLVSTDAPGLEALLLIEQRGATLEGTSPYLLLHLESARPKPALDPPTCRGRVADRTREPRRHAVKRERS